MKLVILSVLFHMFYCVDTDKNTFSNYKEVRTQHLHLEWLLNLNEKIIDGSVEYTFKVFARQLTEIHLDIYKINILFIYYPKNGQVLKWNIESDPIQTIEQGDKLVIDLGQEYQYGEIIKLRIKYQLGQNARAISFMDPEQTDDKMAPYLFSQCQANNCKSMIPLQDTPSIKFTYSATVLTLSTLINVFMSGNRLSTHKFKLMNDYTKGQIANVYQFELNIKIPAYLIAIVAGIVQLIKIQAEYKFIFLYNQIQKEEENNVIYKLQILIKYFTNLILIVNIT